MAGNSFVRTWDDFVKALLKEHGKYIKCVNPKKQNALYGAVENPAKCLTRLPLLFEKRI